MVIRDDFIEVQPGFLIDPPLKLRVHIGGQGDGLDDPAGLCIGYDPEIDPDRLLVPPSEEDRRILLMSPLTAHRVDVPMIFQSRRYDCVFGFFFWNIEGDRVRYKFQDDTYSLGLKAKVMELRHFPAISNNMRDTLLYAISSASRLTEVKGADFSSPGYAEVKSVEVWIRSEALVDFFNLPLAEFTSPEPGWVILSSREIVR
ncbi:hypothetical protein [Bradyrhizobium sp. JYMT SZCCT0180]|uniref:hypothetical protein n=1 Tax=Bradyrhizobium sp. JYMT SZCCT0180 TaxID=2807666 RepID=UPI001BA53D90|nr:hypothetical protein [Bradyrhizobium sp. JYMT SZCCT0180]MBR1211577.1 hypothetical protein [Bradyrhizobium sp. JYMT SZCCT0180]